MKCRLPISMHNMSGATSIVSPLGAPLEIPLGCWHQDTCRDRGAESCCRYETKSHWGCVREFASMVSRTAPEDGDCTDAVMLPCGSQTRLRPKGKADNDLVESIYRLGRLEARQAARVAEHVKGAASTTGEGQLISTEGAKRRRDLLPKRLDR